MKKLTSQALLWEVEKRIKSGEIKIDEDFYEHAVGLSGSDYQFRFPDGWDHPQCYRVVVGPDGKQITDKKWGQKTNKKKKIIPKQ